MGVLPTLSLLAAAAYVALGAVALRRNPHAPLNRTFATLCAAFGLWALGFAFMYDAPSKEACWAWDRVASLGWSVFPALSLHCSLLLAGRRRPLMRPWLLGLLYAPGAALFFRYQLFGLGIEIDYRRLPLGWSPDLDKVIEWFWFFEACVVLYLGAAIAVLVRWARGATLVRERRQAQAVLLSAAVTFAGAFGLDVVASLFGVGPLPPVAPILGLLFAAGTWYAMTRLELMVLSTATASDRILEGIRDLVLLVDPAGTVQDANPPALQALAYPRDELVGAPLANVLGDEEAAGQVLAATRAPAQGAFPVEVAWRRRDGSTLPVWLWGAPVLDPDGDWLGAVLVGRDLSDQRRAEDELVRASGLESLALLTTGLAHDFNNLLVGVVGNLDLAREAAGANRAVTDRLDDAAQAADQARQLAQRMLSFHRGQSATRRPLDLERLVRDAGPVVLRGSGVDLDVRVAPGLRTALGDEGQVAQVLHNLLINARQAMARGGTVTVELANFDGPPPGRDPGTRLPGIAATDAPGAGTSWVCLSVTDQGPGIPADQQDRLWEPFFTTKPGGSGLGLPSSLSLARRLGGTLRLESEPGRGATFRFFLPAGPGVP